MTEAGRELELSMQVPRPYEDERSLLLRRLKELEDEQDYLLGMMTRIAPVVEQFGLGRVMPRQIRIDEYNIEKASIKTAKIDDLAVTNAKIGNLAVTTAKIFDAAITNAKIDNLAVDNAKIANLAVTTAKIEDLAVSSAKIALLAVGNAQIADLAVDNAKIANLAVDSAKIADLAVGSAKIANVLQSDNFQEGSAGWRIKKDGTAEFEHVIVRGEIRASCFKYGTMSAIGGKIVISDASKLIAEMDTMQTTIDVAEQAFTLYDLVCMKDVVGGAVQLEWMWVCDNGTPITGGYRYNVIRDIDGSGANSWTAGTAVVEFGWTDESQYGGAWVELASDEAGGELFQAMKRTGAAYNAYAKQVWIDSDGALKAAEGDITLDAYGLSLKAWPNKVAKDVIAWKDGATIFGEIYSTYSEDAPNRNARISIRSLGEGSGTATVYLEAVEGGITHWLGLEKDTLGTWRTVISTPRLEFIGTGSIIRFENPYTEIWRDIASGNLSLKDANAGTKTLKQLASISQYASCSSILTLTITKQDVPGCSLSLGAGTYLIWGTFGFRGNNQGSYAYGYLDVGGVEQTAQAQWRPSASADSAGMPCQLWQVTLGSTTTVKLQAIKSVDVGIFTARSFYTNIAAIRTGD